MQTFTAQRYLNYKFALMLFIVMPLSYETGAFIGYI
jgi:hypothetical protein